MRTAAETVPTVVSFAPDSRAFIAAALASGEFVELIASRLRDAGLDADAKAVSAYAVRALTSCAETPPDVVRPVAPALPVKAVRICPLDTILAKAGLSGVKAATPIISTSTNP